MKISLKKKINRYLKKKQLFKNQKNIRFEKPFLIKSRKNFTISNLLFKISEQEDIKKMLSLSSGFDMYEWVIITSYYSMYTAALAAIANLGFKSKSHAATIVVLKNFYVKRGKLNTKHINNLSKAYTLSEELITKLMKTKTNREIAQYDATPTITRENAKTSLEDADEFITKIEEITTQGSRLK